MSLGLTPDQKEIGKRNFNEATGELHRRGFMKSVVAGAAIVPVSAAVYYGYQSWKGNKAVRTALIGTGDEGGVLIGDHNPAFNEIVAVCDLRPSNIDRIFDGEKEGPRKGLKVKYGSKARDNIKSYDSVKALLDDKKKLELEAVIIATPLNTHDKIAKMCMDAGVHVFCEKLMARTIMKCKEMIEYAQKPDKRKDKGGDPLLLGIGHQRHYSTLYAHAVEVVKSGILGDIKHIKAQWPRNNSWPFVMKPEDKDKYDLNVKNAVPYYNDGWCKPVLLQDSKAFSQAVAEEWGFKDIEQLVRWRLYDSTGGGLMAELGSHQLDASSIFLGHVHPLSVQGIGGKFFYGPGRNDRESDDGIFVNFEFPGKSYYKRDNDGHVKKKDGKPEIDNADDKVIVSYTSFNTNSYEQYGECLMGSRGTMIVEMEKDIYLFKEPDKTAKTPGGRDTKVSVTGGKAPEMASSTWGAAGGATVLKAATGAAWDTPVRGYQTELEHFAFCVRNWNKAKGWAKKPDGKFEQAVPNCHGEVAMADAIIALTANMAMKKGERIKFEESWFEAEKMGKEDVPETKYAS